MPIIIYAWLLGAGVATGASAGDSSLVRWQSAQLHMGTLITVVLYANDEGAANRGFDAAFSRFRQLDGIMSDYDPESELSRLSRSAPAACGVPVSEDLWRVLAASQSLSDRSHGAFDATVGPLTKLWRRTRRQKELPSPSRLQAALAAVGYKHLQLDPNGHKVQLLRPNMRLDLGGIAKGFASDEALAALRQLGLPRALVNAGGGISAGDPPPGRAGWRIAVAPLDRDAAPSRFLCIANNTVATSGDAWQSVEIGGRRYSHIIDPRTGLGLTTRSSVTVVAPDGAVSDGLATAISVLGPEEGLALAEKTPRVAALIVQVVGEAVQVHESRRFADHDWPPGPPADGGQSTGGKQPRLQSPSAIIRIEPEPVLPACERWTRDAGQTTDLFAVRH